MLTTEAQSHGAYINHAFEQRFDLLVTKPLILPIKEGVLDHQALMPISVKAIAEASVNSGVNTAMLCLRQLHEIYETNSG